ncbi:macro domain-containing protein [Paenibacillus methanolicus]|uniref:O-acetyl-ADP-ribose deacetylase (Regulator of RNase III) n=1 Tax=Paenibacillus methanolicus TaxID=582686 RepID=A0A5S5BRB6_9BACL|nr:macro domain-containing protein [Paenibacillus methanolicus]TYP69721.1 O-acetyl-ADP-ribose deacetylase (regulator of RNase III) [Paenibacillus methanolicus]
MGIQVKAGDLLQAAEHVIGHQVNCQGVMGSGVAKSIRAQFPEAYEAYLELCSRTSNEELLGRCQMVQTPDGKHVANLFGQFNYGRQPKLYTDYDALRQALSQLKGYARERGLTVALPYQIGCGLANGDWSIVEAMINEIFEDYEVTLYRL